ncbi:MAG: hypothetical protein A2Z20_00665 [Bdellovibrionales bacterium RBG_16_40_8]|nr:MAG: hypothetical protein A2Z20_00665 [Bdellovibrionales bacterium RBG_16_40_8]
MKKFICALLLLLSTPNLRAKDIAGAVIGGATAGMTLTNAYVAATAVSATANGEQAGTWADTCNYPAGLFSCFMVAGLVYQVITSLQDIPKVADVAPPWDPNGPANDDPSTDIDFNGDPDLNTNNQTDPCVLAPSLCEKIPPNLPPEEEMCKKNPDYSFCKRPSETDPCKLYPQLKVCHKELELAAQGLGFDKNGNMITPEGNIPKDLMDSGKKMAEAGFLSPKDASAYDEALAKAKKNMPSVASVPVNGGGSGARGGGANSEMPDTSFDDFYKNMYGNQTPKDPKTKGLTRTLASGESIGSQTDNIFEMINRRYDQKKQEKIFVEK